jgi:tripartite-type tricarboxylate transporter receptor subunit TctC
VRVIVPFAPGGGSDVVARQVNTRLQASLGQPFVIDNRGGAGGLLGMEQAARSPADGYTILVMSDGFPVLAATRRPGFDPMNSLMPIAQLCIAPCGMLVHPSVPANTVAEFIALARAQPGKFSYGSSGSGGLPHLITEGFKRAAGIEMTHVPYKGSGAVLPDLLAGTVAMSIGSISPVQSLVQTGKLRLLAVTNEKRWPLLPNVPTIGETVKGFHADPWFGAFAPRGTPREAIDRLNAAVRAVAADPAFVESLRGQGLLPKTGSAAEFGQIVREDYVRWTTVVQDIGFKPTD